MTKRFLGILVLGLLLSSNAYSKSANELNKERCEKNPDAFPKCKGIIEKALEAKKTLNDYLNEGYKITSEELVKGERYLLTIFVLKRRGSIVICKFNHFSNGTSCRKP